MNFYYYGNEFRILEHMGPHVRFFSDLLIHLVNGAHERALTRLKLIPSSNSFDILSSRRRIYTQSRAS